MVDNPNLLIYSIILLIIACEEDMLRNNQYDPGSDNTIIGSIAGFVSPSSSNALVSAKRGSNIYESTIIESDGKFELTNLPEGIYTIVVEANNFLTDSSLTNIQVIPKVNFSVGTVYINSAIHGTISGKVEPYNSSVQIILIKDGSEPQSTNLNEKSEFNFSMLDPGIYEIQISLELTFTEFKLAGFAIFATLVARLVIYPLVGLSNIKNNHPIPKNWKHVIYWSGLRGSIPIALLLLISNMTLHETNIQLSIKLNIKLIL